MAITVPQPSPEQQIVGCGLSNFLADRRQQIISEWMIGIRNDDHVPATDGLTVSQLKDHIPQLLDELNLTLTDAFSQEVKNRTAWQAARHGNIRWHQNYDVAQLIREIAALRTVLTYRLAEFQDEHMPNSYGKNGLFAMVVVHSFFDRVIRLSVEQFLATSQTIKRADQKPA